LCRAGVFQVVFGDEGVEAASVAVVAVLHAGDVIGRGPGLHRHLEHLAAGHVEKLRARVDEAGDQPGAGDAVDLGAFAGDPFHDFSFG
jgi:hypothetical protein